MPINDQRVEYSGRFPLHIEAVLYNIAAMGKAWQKAEDEFDAYIASLGKRAWVHKLTDAAEVRGRTGRIGKMRDQPCDRIVVIDGQTYFAEIKSTSDPTAFRFSLLRKKQMAHAKLIQAAGGTYLVFLKRNETGEWFRIPYDAIRKCNRKSLRWDELKEFHFSDIQPGNG